MTLIDHGSWVRYTPSELPEDAPTFAMFCKRVNDDQDWYEYVHPGTSFDAASVKLTVSVRETNGPTIISAPAVDATMLFPQDHQLVEILGDYSAYTTSQLIDQFANKVIDLETGEITDPPPVKILPSEFEVKIMSTLDLLVKRLEKLEKTNAS